MLKKADLIQWKRDEKTQFQGWDFSYLKGRYKEGKPNWNYTSIAKRIINKSNFVLDMATGGGEIFLEVLSSYIPKKAVAIEGYKPNVPIAQNNLRRSGVKVVYAKETGKLPFNNNEFDLVLNRHGRLNIPEIARIVAHG
ncbi:MAG: class I SAM-dependent methyltransferase, partial [Nanoarchaeota archaeon]